MVKSEGGAYKYKRRKLVKMPVSFRETGINELNCI